jgi:hypothetical protein
MGKITGNEYLQYITEQLVEYIDKPAEDRKQAKKIAKAQKEQWLSRWFGVGGISLMLWLKKRKKQKQS